MLWQNSISTTGRMRKTMKSILSERTILNAKCRYHVSQLCLMKVKSGWSNTCGQKSRQKEHYLDWLISLVVLLKCGLFIRPLLILIVTKISPQYGIVYAAFPCLVKNESKSNGPLIAWRKTKGKTSVFNRLGSCQTYRKRVFKLFKNKMVVRSFTSHTFT